MKHLYNMAMKVKAKTEVKTIKEWFELLPQTIKAEAIYLAVDVYRNHQFEKGITDNPLAIAERPNRGSDRFRDN